MKSWAGKLWLCVLRACTSTLLYFVPWSKRVHFRLVSSTSKTLGLASAAKAGHWYTKHNYINSLIYFLYSSFDSKHDKASNSNRISDRSTTFWFNLEMSDTKKKIFCCCWSVLHTFFSTLNAKKYDVSAHSCWISSQIWPHLWGNPTRVILTSRRLRLLKGFTILKEVRMLNFGVSGSSISKSKNTPIL